MPVVTEELIDSLPNPVQNSLRASGVVGTEIPNRVAVRQRGRIRTSAESKWLRFKARETYEVEHPEFEWKAALKIGGVTVGRAIDSLRDGRGRMDVKLLGLMNVVEASGSELDQGSLMRWLNETMWFPAVWASGLIKWRPRDEHSATGSVRSHGLEVAAEFCFDDEGRLVNFRADRYRDIGGGDFKMSPWSTPLDEHRVMAGVRVPASGAGVWHLADGDFEYIQIHATEVQYSM